MIVESRASDLDVSRLSEFFPGSSGPIKATTTTANTNQTRWRGFASGENVRQQEYFAGCICPAPQEPEPEEDCYLRAKRRMITAGWGRLRCSLGRHPDPTCKGRGGVLDSGISRVGSGRLQTVRVLSCAQVDQSRRPQQQLTRPLAAQRRALRPNPLARVRKRRKR